MNPVQVFGCVLLFAAAVLTGPVVQPGGFAVVPVSSSLTVPESVPEVISPEDMRKCALYENVCIRSAFTTEDCSILLRYIDELDRAVKYQDEIDELVAREETFIGSVVNYTAAEAPQGNLAVDCPVVESFFNRSSGLMEFLAAITVLERMVKEGGACQMLSYNSETHSYNSEKAPSSNSAAVRLQKTWHDFWYRRSTWGHAFLLFTVSQQDPVKKQCPGFAARLTAWIDSEHGQELATLLVLHVMDFMDTGADE